MEYLHVYVVASIENRGLKPVQEIWQKLGGWPVVQGDSWNGQNFTWERTDELLHSSGYNPKSIYHLYVMRDVENPSNNVLYVRKPTLNYKNVSIKLSMNS